MNTDQWEARRQAELDKYEADARFMVGINPNALRSWVQYGRAVSEIAALVTSDGRTAWLSFKGGRRMSLSGPYANPWGNGAKDGPRPKLKPAQARYSADAEKLIPSLIRQHSELLERRAASARKS